MTSSNAPTTRDVALLLADIGVLFELNGRDPFRAKAFMNAARALEGSGADLHRLARQDRLETLRGIGPAIAAIIREYLATGKAAVYEELRGSTPLALYDLLRVEGLGARRIHTLHEKLGIEDLDSLEAAAREGRIAPLPGFGQKTEERILAGIAFARSNRQLRRYPDALEVAVRLLEWIRERPEVSRAEIAGSLRRRLEVVDQIDILVATRNPAAVLAAFSGLEATRGNDAGSLDEGRREATIRLSDGVTARLRCVSAAGFEAAFLWETGNERHLQQVGEAAAAAGMTLGPEGLSREGRKVQVRTERRLYERTGLTFIPPELREGLGEVTAARDGLLPRLVELPDLRGTFHCHTTDSDGKATLEEMAEGARDRGWAYLGIADHSRNAGYAGGLSVEQVLRQHEEIDALNAALAGQAGEPFRIFKGIESDILADGSLDYPAEVLRRFDYVIGSVHSLFRMDEATMTKRMVAAIRNPALTMLGHPMGRLLLTRPGYPLDIGKVLKAAAKSGVVMEINANPHRLDLDWRHVREAAAMGIIIAINPDAHSVRALDHVAFGVNMARKAGLEPRQVLNTWTLDEVTEYLAARKEGR